jgi:hypothetical protein
MRRCLARSTLPGTVAMMISTRDGALVFMGALGWFIWRIRPREYQRFWT